MFWQSVINFFLAAVWNQLVGMVAEGVSLKIAPGTDTKQWDWNWKLNASTYSMGHVPSMQVVGSLPVPQVPVAVDSPSMESFDFYKDDFGFEDDGLDDFRRRRS